jgi:hypothetical protein
MASGVLSIRGAAEPASLQFLRCVSVLGRYSRRLPAGRLYRNSWRADADFQSKLGFPSRTICRSSKLSCLSCLRCRQTKYVVVTKT